MIAAIHQPNYLPWLGYFYKILNSDVFILLDDVQYAKNSYINRTRIKGPAGPQWLTVPAITKGRYGQAINEVEIDSQAQWWKKQPKTIEYAYRRAVTFADYWPVLQETYSTNWDRLALVNISLIRKIANSLGIKTEIVTSSQLQPKSNKTSRLVELCRAVGANAYLSGSGGQKYQDEEAFRAAGIELHYSDFRHPRYPQLWGDFVEGLSIIDLLLNCGKQSREILERSSKSETDQ